MISKARKKSFLTIAYKTDIIKKWIKNLEDIMKILYTSIREILVTKTLFLKLLVKKLFVTLSDNQITKQRWGKTFNYYSCEN